MHATLATWSKEMMYQLNSCLCLLGRRKQVLSIWKSSLSCLMSVFGVVVWSFTILGPRLKIPDCGEAGRSHDPCWKIVSIMTEQKHSSRSISIDNRLSRSAMMMKITVCPRAGWGVVLASPSLYPKLLIGPFLPQFVLSLANADMTTRSGY